LEYNPFNEIIDTKGQKLQGSLFGNAFGGQNAMKVAPMSPIFLEVPCTLQEFYNGCVKVVQYERQKVALDGQNMEIERVSKKIHIKRGLAESNLVIFKGEGNEQRLGPATDLIISHVLFYPKEGTTADLLKRYKRRGNDLIYTHRLSLEQNFEGAPVRVETLDGKVLMVSVDEIIGSNTLKRVFGAGMPIYKSHVKNDHEVLSFGDLYICFDLQFPHSLTESQKERIAALLA
jgi:DnaJ-class molecular chaperone